MHAFYSIVFTEKIVLFLDAYSISHPSQLAIVVVIWPYMYVNMIKIVATHCSMLHIMYLQFLED